MKRFVNIHIPKCGGTTFTSILKSNFRDSFIDGRSVLSDRVFKYSAEDVSSVFRQFPCFRCFSDHKLSVELPWDQFDITAICFVRDPVERFLSHYFYTRQESKTCFDVEAKSLDLKDYIEEVLHVNPKQD